MRVIHVAAPAGVGGLERVVQWLCLGQAERGAEVHLAAVLPDGAPSPLLDAAAAGGVATHRISVPPRAYRRERAALLELCRRIRPDVTHFHGYRPLVVDAPAARRLGIPTVATVHGFTGGGWTNRVYERLERRACRRATAVVAVSAPLAAELVASGVPRERVHLLPNAWRDDVPRLDRPAARRALGVPADGRRVGWVGRMSREKGADVLVDALAALTDLDVAASFVGDGPERPGLEARARRVAPEAVVRWHGAVPEAARLFAAFDVFVLSSRTEGTPIVLFEAMAAGTPIVAARVGGVPDVVSVAEAMLVPPDDPGALAAAIRTVFAEPAAAGARARAAHARLASGFGYTAWLERHEALYERLASRRAAAVVA